jgi:RecA/RadA recombinase
VVRPLSSRQLAEALDAIGAVAGGSTRVALVVLDSVGALVRAEFDRDARFRRVENLAALAATNYPAGKVTMTVGEWV